MEQSAERWARWRAARERFAVAERGPLALEGTYWVTVPQQAFPGVPGRWSPPRGVRGLLLDADAGVLDAGVLQAGGPAAGGLRSGAPAASAEQARLVPVTAETDEGPLRFADGRLATVIAGETASLDGGFALRVWNPASAAIGGFGRISAFDYDPAWVVEARVESPERTTAEIGHVRDGDRLRTEPVPAEMVFERDGAEHRLLALAEPPGLLVVFADATTGSESYGVGRFLMLQPRRDGTVTLDFNRAYLPPCAFSMGYNCPVPPRQNRLPLRIEAGERQVLAAGGTVLSPAAVPGWCA